MIRAMGRAMYNTTKAPTRVRADRFRSISWAMDTAFSKIAETPDGGHKAEGLTKYPKGYSHNRC